MWFLFLVVVQGWLPPWIPPWLGGEDLVVRTGPVVLWSEGEVRPLPLGGARQLPPEDDPRSVSVGDVLAGDHVLRLGPRARLWLQIEEGRVDTWRGAATLRVVDGRLLAPPGSGARSDVLEGYASGRYPIAAASSATTEGAGPGRLVILEPMRSTVRSRAPVVRWRWAARDADVRFDLELAHLASDGAARVLESWRGLTGRAHAIYAPLTRGERYRATVEVAGARGLMGEATRDTVEFEVLGEGELRAVEGSLDALRALQARADSLRPEVQVLRARLLESYGLWAEAEAVWSALSLMYPRRAELRAHARRLHDRARQRRR